MHNVLRKYVHENNDNFQRISYDLSDFCIDVEQRLSNKDTLSTWCFEASPGTGETSQVLLIGKNKVVKVNIYIFSYQTLFEFWFLRRALLYMVKETCFWGVVFFNCDKDTNLVFLYCIYCRLKKLRDFFQSKLWRKFAL